MNNQINTMKRKEIIKLYREDSTQSAFNEQIEELLVNSYKVIYCTSDYVVVERTLRFTNSDRVGWNSFYVIRDRSDE